MLICDVTGNPAPIVSWKFQKKSVGLQEITKMEDCSTRTKGFYHIAKYSKQLVICHMSYKEHQGQYRCIAKNKIAIVKRNINVEIFGKLALLGLSTFAIISNQMNHL